MPALARRWADAVYSIGPMLAKHSGPVLARNRLHSGAAVAQCRHYVICRNDADRVGLAQSVASPPLAR